MRLLQCGNWILEGKSSSAVATYIRVKELDLIFDLGRCPMRFIGTNHVFISHFHLDHYFGLPVYISQRWLAGMPPGNVYIPSNGFKQLKNILNKISVLDGGQNWGYQLTPVEVGDTIPFRKNLIAHILPGNHSVPAVSYLICENRKKLKPEYHDLSGKEIVALKRSGVDVTNDVQLPLVAYLGDTRGIALDAHPLLKQCKLLICECTFIAPEHRERAKQTKHLHIDMLPSLLEEFESEYIVLNHFSRRYTPEFIQQEVFKRLSASEHSRVHLFI